MRKRILVAVIGAFVALAICGGIVDGCSSDDSKSGAEIGTAVSTSTAAPVQKSTPAAPVTTAAKPAPVKPAPTTPAAPKLTVSQQNAVDKAHEYLEFEAFSLKGLIKQLEYEGFSHADAAYGAGHSGADWNAQAVAKAKEYLQMESFSRSGLIKQLEYEGFTSAQAQHGATGAGL